MLNRLAPVLKFKVGTTWRWLYFTMLCDLNSFGNPLDHLLVPSRLMGRIAYFPIGMVSEASPGIDSFASSLVMMVSILDPLSIRQGSLSGGVRFFLGGGRANPRPTS